MFVCENVIRKKKLDSLANVFLFHLMQPRKQESFGSVHIVLRGESQTAGTQGRVGSRLRQDQGAHDNTRTPQVRGSAVHFQTGVQVLFGGVSTARPQWTCLLKGNVICQHALALFCSITIFWELLFRWTRATNRPAIRKTLQLPLVTLKVQISSLESPSKASRKDLTYTSFER